MFISFEGIDGSGKTTQSRYLAAALRERGYAVQLTAEPGGTPMGARVKELVLSGTEEDICPLAELCLYLADRAQHVTAVVAALHRGEVVVSDRYADATVAYQGYGRQLDVARIHRLNQWVTGGCMPDLTILLDLEPAQAAGRRRCADRMEAAADSFHERVRCGYLELARQYPGRIRVVPAGGPPEDIGVEVRRMVLEKLQKDS